MSDNLAGASPVEQRVRPLRTGCRFINVHEGTGLPEYFIPADPGTEWPFVPYEMARVVDVRYWKRCEALLRMMASATTDEGLDNCRRIAQELLRHNVEVSCRRKAPACRRSARPPCYAALLPERTNGRRH